MNWQFDLWKCFCTCPLCTVMFQLWHRFDRIFFFLVWCLTSNTTHKHRQRNIQTIRKSCKTSLTAVIEPLLSNKSPNISEYLWMKQDLFIFSYWISASFFCCCLTFISLQAIYLPPPSPINLIKCLIPVKHVPTYAHSYAPSRRKITKWSFSILLYSH